MALNDVPTQAMVEAMLQLLDDTKATQVAVTFVMTAHSARTALVRHATLLDVADQGDAGDWLAVPAGVVIEVKDHEL